MNNFGIRHTPGYRSKLTSFICPGEKDQMLLKAIVLGLLTSILITCEKDTGLNPEYEPVETKHYGSVSALVQELSFRSNGFTIVGDLHPAVIMVHGSVIKVPDA